MYYSKFDNPDNRSSSCQNSPSLPPYATYFPPTMTLTAAATPKYSINNSEDDEMYLATIGNNSLYQARPPTPRAPLQPLNLAPPPGRSSSSVYVRINDNNRRGRVERAWSDM